MESGLKPDFYIRKKPHCLRFSTGVERIELPSAVLETDVLPLYDTPKKKMVTRTGFEPVNAAVKGRCVKPLHQLATTMAPETGLEPVTCRLTAGRSTD